MARTDFILSLPLKKVLVGSLKMCDGKDDALHEDKNYPTNNIQFEGTYFSVQLMDLSQFQNTNIKTNLKR